MTPQEVLQRLRGQVGVPLAKLPSTSGIYALRDHESAIRYIGIAKSEGFYVRIRNKHTTGSEGRSHKFSHAYNVGRMWRDRHCSQSKNDGIVAKALRTKFILRHCSASFVELADLGLAGSDLAALEKLVQSACGSDERRWEGSFCPEPEPKLLVERLMAESATISDREAVERQRRRFQLAFPLLH